MPSFKKRFIVEQFPGNYIKILSGLSGNMQHICTELTSTMIENNYLKHINRTSSKADKNGNHQSGGSWCLDY